MARKKDVKSQGHTLTQRRPTSSSKQSPPSAGKPLAKKRGSFSLVGLVCKLFGLVASLVKMMICVVVFVCFVVYMLYGGGKSFPNTHLAKEPLFDSSSMEKLIDLQYPPGNIAVSSQGRVFFSLHPDAHPPVSICELVQSSKGSACKPYPSKGEQELFQSVLSVRIAPDENGRELLWTLDHGLHGFGQPRLLAFDLEHGTIVDEFNFPPEIAGWGSMLNDFQIDPRKQIIYMADTSFIRKKPSLIVYDIKNHSARRILDGHPSVKEKGFKISINNTDCQRDMIMFGVVSLRINVDSIALDREGKFLYYSSINDPILYQVHTADLLDIHLSEAEIGNRVVEFINMTQSDGMTTDNEGNIYYADMENSAVMRVNTKFSTPVLETLLSDVDLLRWPDGFSFGAFVFCFVYLVIGF